MMLEIHVQAWDRPKKVVGLNWLTGSKPSPFDNWIPSGNTCINMRLKIVSIKKNTYYNDNKNMDSSIAGLMNTRS